MSEKKNELLPLIQEEINAYGPISIARYMDLALSHEQHGYYRKQDPFGADGDFITSPDISQMFGEMVGLWCACVAQMMDGGKPLNLVEVGPGRGTLMVDALRAASTAPGFLENIQVSMVETSPVLRAMQKEALESFGVKATWHDDIKDVADGPLLVIGNEFFDALPVRQYVYGDGEWHERLVGLNGEKLAFVMAAEAEPEGLVPEKLQAKAQAGDVFEDQAASRAVMKNIAARIAKFGGAALFFDYGHDEHALGNTFQAMKAHKFVDVLSKPGNQDLTTHVDFEQLSKVAEVEGAEVFGPVAQGIFLQQLGMGQRAETLKAKASEEQIFDVNRAYTRLVSPEQMGTLFRVMGIASTGLSVPPWS